MGSYNSNYFNYNITGMNNKKFNYDLFAKHFKKTLKYGDSLRSVAPKVGVSVATLSRALSGSKKTRLETAFKMSDYSGFDINKYWN